MRDLNGDHPFVAPFESVFIGVGDQLAHDQPDVDSQFVVHLKAGANQLDADALAIPGKGAFGVLGDFIQHIRQIKVGAVG